MCLKTTVCESPFGGFHSWCPLPYLQKPLGCHRSHPLGEHPPAHRYKAGVQVAVVKGKSEMNDLELDILLPSHPAHVNHWPNEVKSLVICSLRTSVLPLFPLILLSV